MGENWAKSQPGTCDQSKFKSEISVNFPFLRNHPQLPATPHLVLPIFTFHVFLLPPEIISHKLVRRWLLPKIETPGIFPNIAKMPGILDPRELWAEGKHCLDFIRRSPGLLCQPWLPQRVGHRDPNQHLQQIRRSSKGCRRRLWLFPAPTPSWRHDVSSPPHPPHHPAPLSRGLWSAAPAPAKGKEEIVALHVSIQGDSLNVSQSRKVMLRALSPGIFIQTDKAVYKPGQEVKFRVVSLDKDLTPSNQTLPLVLLKDPSGNRIAQWRSVTPRQGIADLSLPLASEPALGTYTIGVEGKSHSFSVEEYVLPKFEVIIHLPGALREKDETFPVRICGRYTYGKPVQGKVQAGLCFSQRLSPYRRGKTCSQVTGKTEKNGCFSTEVSLAAFETTLQLREELEVEALLVEDGTGLEMKSTKSCKVLPEIVTVTFEKPDHVYKPGLPYTGTVRVQRAGSTGLPQKQVLLLVKNKEEEKMHSFVTDGSGRASFQLDASGWRDRVSLRAQVNRTAESQEESAAASRAAFLTVMPYWSRSGSFLHIRDPEGELPCGRPQLLHLDSIFGKEALGSEPKNLDLVFMVLAKGSITSIFRKEVTAEPGQRVSLSLEVPIGPELAPMAQLLVYVVLPNGEMVADSTELYVAKCFPNQGAALKLFTNAKTREDCAPMFRSEHPIVGMAGPGGAVAQPNYVLKSNIIPRLVGASNRDFPAIEGREEPPAPRVYFPETWLWDLVPVGEGGSAEVTVTVPDAITEWEAGMFCTAPQGLGLSPAVTLTAFQPFFVELALPYAVVRHETFTLRATVFNYLRQCLRVQVTLAESAELEVSAGAGDSYRGCVCAEEAKTFQWGVRATSLGEVNITVSTEALSSTEPCGNELPLVPAQGRVDTVIKPLLVQPGGILVEKAHSSLLCREGAEEVSLEIPPNILESSQRAHVTVMGDILGNALQNLDSLLAMPYGCGEQNMVRFAPNIYIQQYLEKTGQLLPDIRAKAQRFLQSGYQRELLYKHDDGSYSAFGKSDARGNTWLTAFVLKSFGQARAFVAIEERHITDALLWLRQRQRRSGCFRSTGKLFNNALAGRRLGRALALGVRDGGDAGAGVTHAGAGGELSPEVPGGFSHGQPLHTSPARLRVRAGGAAGAAAGAAAAPGPAQRQHRGAALLAEEGEGSEALGAVLGRGCAGRGGDDSLRPAGLPVPALRVPCRPGDSVPDRPLALQAAEPLRGLCLHAGHRGGPASPGQIRRPDLRRRRGLGGDGDIARGDSAGLCAGQQQPAGAAAGGPGRAAGHLQAANPRAGLCAGTGDPAL
uniref:Alpha-2-macroglobulin like 1 n=1 Tax=Ficedula albicollis TaxID=59894 RepID=A0A803VEP0_FICAL